MKTHEATCWVNLVQNEGEHLEFIGMDVGVCKVKEKGSFLEIETENEELAKEVMENIQEDGWEISIQGQSHEYVLNIETFKESFPWFKEEFPEGPAIRYDYGHEGQSYVIKGFYVRFPGAEREMPRRECSFIQWENIESVRVIVHSSWYEKTEDFKIEVEGKTVRMKGLNPTTCGMGLHFKIMSKEEEIECPDYIIDEMSVLKGM